MDCAASDEAERAALRQHRGASSLPLGLERPASRFPRLRQALEREWQRAASGEALESARHEGNAVADGARSGDDIQQVRQGTTSIIVPPTPSEVLTASSIRMMLGMASAFRRTNPEVLQVMCGTLLDLLLETPPLVLAPLHRSPSSLEAITFGRVGDFCAELIGSDQRAEREPALGLYLALAISRGQVSGMLEVVRCLLDRSREANLGGPSAGGGNSESPTLVHCSGFSPPSPAAAAAAAAGEPEQGPAGGPRDARVSAMLDRLASHRVDLHLPFPGEREGTRLSTEVPTTLAEGSGRLSEAHVANVAVNQGCPASAATDGRFIFAWHPDIGLVKAGTGLGGTAKGRVYAQNSETRHPDASGGTASATEGFVAVVGDMVYLHTGRFVPPYRFVLARASDLEVRGTADLRGLPVSAPSAMAGGAGCRREGDGEGQPGGASSEDLGLHVPLCCDGRLVYAIVPDEGTGRPAVVAVDVASTGGAVGPPVELRRPRSPPAALARDTGMPGSQAPHPGQENERQARGRREESPGIGEEKSACPASPKEWPWWRAGSGARRGVRTYCNGSILAVCWVDEEAAATEDPSAPGRSTTERGKSSARDGLVPSPNSAGEGAGVLHPALVARFDLSTGEPRPAVESSAILSETRATGVIPCFAYHSASSLFLRCELRRPPPPPPMPSDHGAVPPMAELRVCLWSNCGPAPGPIDDGVFGWRGALGTLAKDPSGGAPSETAVFVLAHLDRLGAHYSGWKGDADRAGGIEPPSSPTANNVDRLSVPFCYDVSAPTFRHLVALVEKFAAPFGMARSGEDEEREGTAAGVPGEFYVLCASLRLLSVNVGILLARGLGIAEFGGEGLQQSLLKCLLGLVRHCDADRTRTGSSSSVKSPGDGQAGRTAAAREALRLLVGGVDLFYPSRERQADLLSSHLRAYRTIGESHTAASRAVMLELLARTSSLGFLRRLLAAAPGGEGPPPSETAVEQECLLDPGLECSFREESARAPESTGGFAEALLELSTALSVRGVREAGGEGDDAPVGDAAKPRAGNAPLVRQPSDGTKQVGLAVLESLCAVLQLRCIDAFEAAKAGRSDGVESAAAAEFRAFLLLVLQAADNVLAAAVETRRRSSADGGGGGGGGGGSGVLESVVGALRGGLVGALLPSCLASALVLLDGDEKDGPGPGATDLLPQVTQKLRLLAGPGQELRGLEGSPPGGATAEVTSEMAQVDCGVPAAGVEEGQRRMVSPIGATP